MLDNSESLIGQKIGKYRVVEVLGYGAMGVVLKAEREPQETGEPVEKDLGSRFVAIKVLSAQVSRDGVSKERMLREAEMLRRLHHPNIVETREFGLLKDGRAYLVMEFVQGETLDSYLDRSKIAPVDLVVNIGLQLANAMQVAHERGVIHRDLKPPNVMLAKVEGQLFIKVLDFGVARLMDEERRLTRTGEVVGSPIYMSPEQCQGKPMDSRSDIYSLGIVLFYSLTGWYPHKGNTLRDTFVLKTTMPCPSIKEKNPGYDGPVELDKLIQRCLSIEPDDRYPSMEEVFVELQEIAERYQISTAPVPGLGDEARRVTADSNQGEPIGVDRLRAFSAKSSGSGPAKFFKRVFDGPTALVVISVCLALFFAVISLVPLLRLNSQ